MRGWYRGGSFISAYSVFSNRSLDLCTLVAFSDSFSLFDCNNNSMYQLVKFTLYVRVFSY